MQKKQDFAKFYERRDFPKSLVSINVAKAESGGCNSSLP